MRRLPTFLAGRAFAVFRRLGDGQRDTIAHLRQALVDTFLPAEERGARYQEFDTCSMKPDESVDHFVYRLEQLLSMAIPALDGDARQAILKQRLIKGMEPDVRRRLYENPTLTYAQCITTAKQLLSAAKQVADDSKPGGVIGRGSTDAMKIKQEPVASGNALHRGYQYSGTSFNAQQGNLSGVDPRRNYSAVTRPYGAPTCYTCGEVGHINRFCPHRATAGNGSNSYRNLPGSNINPCYRQPHNVGQSRTQTSPANDTQECFVCGKRGHSQKLSISFRTREQSWTRSP